MVGRTRPKLPYNGAYVADNCSGIIQQPWDFSNVFKAITQ
jgi:hypothetical protein